MSLPNSPEVATRRLYVQGQGAPFIGTHRAIDRVVEAYEEQQGTLIFGEGWSGKPPVPSAYKYEMVVPWTIPMRGCVIRWCTAKIPFQPCARMVYIRTPIWRRLGWTVSLREQNSKHARPRLLKKFSPLRPDKTYRLPALRLLKTSKTPRGNAPSLVKDTVIPYHSTGRFSPLGHTKKSCS